MKMKKALVVIIAFMLIISTSQNVFASENEYFDEKSAEMKINEEQRRELREIWNDHPVELDNIESTRFLELSDKKVILRPDPGFTGIGSEGDILIALDSITDHVGIVMNQYTRIEAHPDNPNGGVDYRDNNWKTRYKRIKGMYVKGASWSDCANAVEYCDNQIDEPYNIMSGRWSENEWYCSKLVWRGWYEQGYDLEGRTYEPRGTHVTPGDILDSSLIVFLYMIFWKRIYILTWYTTI